MLGSELQRKLLCSSAQVASYESISDIYHVSSFHNNFKKVNIIPNKIYEDARF